MALLNSLAFQSIWKFVQKTYSLNVIMNFFRGFLTIVSVTAVSSVVLEVPGYATIKGTQGISAYNNRTYFSFHNLPYAKQPTNLTRFLVSSTEREVVSMWVGLFTVLGSFSAANSCRAVSNKWNNWRSFIKSCVSTTPFFNGFRKWKMSDCWRTLAQGLFKI